MKIVITGHTSGIGKWFFDYYQSQGHSVVGFSRSTGHDVADPVAQQHIVNACADADIFINNAYSGFAQSDIMFKFAKQYSDQQKTIINIGSSITQRYDRYSPEPKYRAAKLSLIESCREAWTDIDTQKSKLHVMLVNPCKTQTGRTLQNPYNTIPMQVQDLCNIILYSLNIKSCCVRELGLGLNYNEQQP